MESVAAKPILCGLAMAAVALSSHAGSMGGLQEMAPVMTLSLGASWSSTLNSQIIYLEPDLAKMYTESNYKNSFFDGDLFLGIQHQVHPGWLGQLGLDISGTSKISHSGDVWDDADPDFNNYYYGYSLRHSGVAVKGVLLKEHDFWWARPYASASLGVGFNRATGFNAVSKLYQAIVAPDFTSHTTTAFSYTLGVGVQSKVVNHCSVGVGYEFSDWGKTALGVAAGQTVNEGIAYSHLYNNALMFNFSYTA